MQAKHVALTFWIITGTTKVHNSSSSWSVNLELALKEDGSACMFANIPNTHIAIYKGTPFFLKLIGIELEFIQIYTSTIIM